MTLKELKTIVDHLNKNNKKDDYNVVINLSQVSVGVEAYVDIKAIYEGMDWEFGQIRIEPTEPIIKKRKDRDICIPKNKAPVFNRRYICRACGNFVHKEDDYCSSCGQNIKGIEE